MRLRRRSSSSSSRRRSRRWVLTTSSSWSSRRIPWVHKSTRLLLLAQLVQFRSCCYTRNGFHGTLKNIVEFPGTDFSDRRHRRRRWQQFATRQIPLLVLAIGCVRRLVRVQICGKKKEIKKLKNASTNKTSPYKGLHKVVYRLGTRFYKSVYKKKATQTKPISSAYE